MSEKDSDNLFNVFADSMPHMAFVANADGEITYFNKSWYQYIGDIHDTEGPIHHPEDLKRTIESWSYSVKTGSPYSIEYRLRRHDGEYRWHLGKANPVRDSDGKIYCWVGTNSDIHENKLLLIKLAESETKFRTITDAMPQMVWSTQPDGFHDYFNNRWYEFTGMAPGTTDGEGWNYLFHPDDQDAAWKQWNLSLETGVPYKIEYRLRHHSGFYRWTLGRAMPIRNEKGEIIRWMGTCTDIHDIKQTEENLRKTQNDLKNSLVTRDEFLSIASHELKTPLTSIKLQTQAMLRNFQKGKLEAFSIERVGLLLENNDRQVNRLVRLVDDMLDLSRIESGKLTYIFKHHDVSEIVQDVYDQLKESINQAECMTSVSIEKNIIVNCDRERIEQVVTNLLTNAMRYGKHKPIEINVSMTINKCLIKVTDHGIGIPPTNIEIIFNRFERLVKASEVSGLGLGLYITKQIVDAHQGKISVESKEGYGSSFMVELPLVGLKLAL